MEFKVGDKVRRKINSESGHRSIWEGGKYNGVKFDPNGTYTIKGIFNNMSGGSSFLLEEIIDTNGWYSDLFELVSSEEVNSNTNMEKKVFNVLVVDKKTGKESKNLSVIALTEQDALLKAFGVEAENLFIKTTELGKFEVKEPVQAVLVEKDKK